MGNRLVFMGSDPIALPMLEAIRIGECGEFEIGAVYTQPDRARGRGKKVQPNEIKVWAQEHGLEVRQPEKMKKPERLEIETLQADAILVMAYGHLLSQALIDAPRKGIWNLHTSLLPRYRGASPIQAAVASGDVETGVSLMKMVRRMDAGPIADVERVRIADDDTALDVEGKLAEACVPLMRRNLSKVFGGTASTTEQDESAATYVRKLSKNDGDLDFRAPATVVSRRVNGLYPWPGARFFYADVPIKVGLALSSGESDAQPGAAGEVLGVDGEGLRVTCGEGVVRLKRLQRPGGKMLEAQDFLRGFDLPVGAVLKSRRMPELVAKEPFKGA